MLQQMEERTGVTPPALASRPKLTDAQRQLHEVFLEVSTCRSYTMAGPLPLSLTDFLSYATMYDLDRETAQDTWRMIRQVDDHWQSEWAAKNPPPKTSKKA